ncbi:MAG: hypothetical protein K8T26_19430 [Lentisphaerae bacterium]|nr:hypothetical protein [Lentisphaerota bacterium]
MSASVEPGTYPATVKAAVIYEAPSGAVMCQMQIDVDGVLLRGGICLIQKDGTLSERGFKDVQAIFGLSGPWDWALWEREPEEWAGADVQVVIETVQGDRGEFSSIKYVNVPGCGAAPLAKADAKALAAKYGSKTRALFGGVPAAAKPPNTKAPPVPPPPAAATINPSTMEACWARFCEVHQGKTELELYPLWAAAVQKHCGKGQNEATPEDWGRFLTAHDDNLPY